MENFTPVAGAVGGAMIGLAAVLLMAVNGRIAGISGIVDGLLAPMREGFDWKAAFVAGLILAPLIYWLIAGTRPAVDFPHNEYLVALGGLLVGYGTRLGSGCTSGHGVCGLARLSKRSLAATLTFMASGFATVFLLRHVAGL